MNLAKKKKMIARTLGIGANRVVITSQGEIKEAITREDIRELAKQGIIKVKIIAGRRKKARIGKREEGSIKKRTRNRKQSYVKLTRKLRDYIKNLKHREKISAEKYRETRKKIKARAFKSLARLTEALRQ